MHYGEVETRSIYGEASLEEARSLHEEGIPTLPLPVLPEDTTTEGGPKNGRHHRGVTSCLQPCRYILREAPCYGL